MKKIFTGVIEQSPLGMIGVGVTERGLAAVDYINSLEEFQARLRKMGFIQIEPGTVHTAEAARQISEYLEGQRHTFDLEIDWEGRGLFQQQALRETFAVPYGQTTTYLEIAQRIGKPQAARAVGRAEATNPMPLVIPCHRVLGRDGRLHGYGGPGGISTKAWLLALEGGTELNSIIERRQI